MLLSSLLLHNVIILIRTQRKLSHNINVNFTSCIQLWLQSFTYLNPWKPKFLYYAKSHVFLFVLYTYFQLYMIEWPQIMHTGSLKPHANVLLVITHIQRPELRWMSGFLVTCWRQGMCKIGAAAANYILGYLNYD